MYDCILYIEQPLNEASLDPRLDIINKTGKSGRIYKEPAFNPAAAYSLGGQIRSALSSLGNQYSVEVSDFGPAVSIRVSYYNPRTCRAASGTYLMVFNDKSGGGTVFTSTAKARTVSDYMSGISYIRSVAYNLQNRTN